MFANGARYLAGIDEVGRGAWAGPVTVGIAVADREALSLFPAGVRDSKMLSPKRREKLFPFLLEAVCDFGVGHASPDECDRHGMTEAQKIATQRAFAQLRFQPDLCIADGLVNFVGAREVILRVGADRDVRLVAGASILAKVTRDRLMIDYEGLYPGYGFADNKGYPSPVHILALGQMGMTAIHRKSWSFADRFLS